MFLWFLVDVSMLDIPGKDWGARKACRFRIGARLVDLSPTLFEFCYCNMVDICWHDWALRNLCRFFGWQVTLRRRMGRGKPWMSTSRWMQKRLRSFRRRSKNFAVPGKVGWQVVGQYSDIDDQNFRNFLGQWRFGRVSLIVCSCLLMFLCVCYCKLLLFVSWTLGMRCLILVWWVWRNQM